MDIDLLDDIRIARPWALALIAMLPVFTVAAWVTARLRRRALLRFGTPGLVGEPEAVRRTSRRFAHASFLLGFASLSIAAAGPGWGTTEEAGLAVGRDVVAVLDMSRSMRAEDMSTSADGDYSRFAAARAALIDLAFAAQQRGGHRLSLVIFATRPTVLVPPTTDYDHFRTKLTALDIRYPPPTIEPDKAPVKSGTRIGAALELAVATHDPRFLGYQDVILVSDGDDPVADEEWRVGIGSARRAEIPVHVVGFGDPDGDAPIPAGDDVMRVNGIPVRTRMHGEVLRRIAEQTRGLYVPAGRDGADLGELFRERIEPRPSRELPEEALPRPHDRSPWFLGPGLALCVLAWWLEDRPKRPRRPRL